MNIAKPKKPNLRDPKTRNAALIILMGAGLMVYGYYEYIQTGIEKLAGLKTTYAQKETELNQILTMKTRLSSLKRQIVADSLKLDSLRLKFPDKKAIPKLLQDLTKVASATGIATVKFKPMPDIVKEYYVENNYSITIEGGYHDLAEFFSFLANMPLIINLGGVSIRANPESLLNRKENDYQETAVRTIVATFTLTTFSSKN
jgi:type IV pilus assembly protein PilO